MTPTLFILFVVLGTPAALVLFLVLVDRFLRATLPKS